MIIKIKKGIANALFYSCGICFIHPSFAAPRIHCPSVCQPTPTPTSKITGIHAKRVLSSPVMRDGRHRGIEEKINLNTATEKDLIGMIPGIGPKRAAAIIAYRDAHERFVSVSELALVKKIGRTFYIKHLLVLHRHLTV